MSKFILEVELKDDSTCDDCPCADIYWDIDYGMCQITGKKVTDSAGKLLPRPSSCPLKPVNEKEQEEITEALRLKRSTDKLYNYINKNGALEGDGNMGGFVLYPKEKP